MKNHANVTLMRNNSVVTEVVTGYHEVGWFPHQIVFYLDPTNKNIFLAYRACDVIEIFTEELEE